MRWFVLGGCLTRRAAHSSGSDDERAAGADQRLGHGFDSAPVCRCGIRPADAEVVVVGGVNDAVRSGRSSAQAFEVIEVAAMNGCTTGCNQFGGCGRSGQAYDAVPSGEQLANDRRANESGRARHEYAHGQASYRLADFQLALDRARCQSLPSLYHGDGSCCQHYDSVMSRWGPDARGRLAKAALELYGERGFDQTTV